MNVIDTDRAEANWERRNNQVGGRCATAYLASSVIYPYKHVVTHMPRSQVERHLRCLVITDSRGKCLASETEGTHTFKGGSVQVEIYQRNGCTIEQATDYLSQVKANLRRDVIILSVGICNLTNKRRAGTQCSIEYTDRKRKDSLKEKINHLLQTYGSKIHIATIAPANILESSQRHSNEKIRGRTLEDLERQQASLLEDCEEINKLIVTSNISRDQPTLTWAEQCFLQSKKRDRRTGRLRSHIKRKFSSKHLPDGLHPDKTLQRTWTNLTKDFIIRLAKKAVTIEVEDESSPEKEHTKETEKRDKTVLSPKEISAQQLPESTEDSTEDEDGGNFKRSRRKNTATGKENPRQATNKTSTTGKGPRKIHSGRHEQPRRNPPGPHRRPNTKHSGRHEQPRYRVPGRHEQPRRSPGRHEQPRRSPGRHEQPRGKNTCRHEQPRKRRCKNR